MVLGLQLDSLSVVVYTQEHLQDYLVKQSKTLFPSNIGLQVCFKQIAMTNLTRQLNCLPSSLLK